MCPERTLTTPYEADKISLITDKLGMLLNCNLFSGNDLLILNNTELLNNKNILLYDAGYDSNIMCPERTLSPRCG